MPDIVLCDVCLPEMDGIEFTRAMRAQERTANLPIALITSSDDSQILARGLDAGADDFLSKPVNALEPHTGPLAVAQQGTGRRAACAGTSRVIAGAGTAVGGNAGGAIQQ